MRERSVKNDETDYYRTRETPSTSPGTLGAIFGCPIGPGSGPGRTRRNERVTRRTPHGLGLRLRARVVAVDANTCFLTRVSRNHLQHDKPPGIQSAVADPSAVRSLLSPDISS